MLFRTTLIPLGLLALAGTAQAQSTVAPGDLPTYSWRGTPYQAEGPVSLEDFRGKPVLIDFWGTR
jgi:hypothetical protein